MNDYAMGTSLLVQRCNSAHIGSTAGFFGHFNARVSVEHLNCPAWPGEGRDQVRSGRYYGLVKI